MARIQELDSPTSDVHSVLARSFQSARLNFLIGAGASHPAIPIAGNVEQEIADLFEAGKEEEARLYLSRFLTSIQEPTNKLINNVDDANNNITLEQYRRCLGTLEVVLRERRTDLLPKQATIFTTNYDLFVERASASYAALNINDGFIRGPRLDGRVEFSSRLFFTQTYNIGNIYDYKVEIPCINFIKLHGSMSWIKSDDEILCRLSTRDLPPDDGPAAVQQFVDGFAVVLPQTNKFRTTLMERTYYELLRIYANELDKANSLLVSFGFSFGDAHILDITKKALKNPTLKLLAFAFNHKDQDAFAEKFEAYNNVEIIAPPAGEEINFQRFNQVLRDSLPKLEQKN